MSLKTSAFIVSSDAAAVISSFQRQAHDGGARVMIQVTTVAQAVQAAERSADVINAQGGESGGYGGDVSTMALVPQVVDAVSPIPVVASGGIFDGRGVAAAFMLGAAAVVRDSVPMLPSPPALDTAAANSAEVQLPMGARTIGASIPKTSQRAVLSICQLQMARTSFYSASNS